ncbi:Glutathione S-transferase, domain-containing protein [Cladophialophora immunda]|nr:Glutathione S-transferase, domain-containing protein [Cladophialophora immunda]
MSSVLARARLQLVHLTTKSKPQATPAQSESTMSSGKGTITDWVKPGDTSGEFKRQVSSFRNWISSDPNAEFPAEKGRYHLYVSYACPWAHRTLIVRKLKGLEEIIPFTSVHWHMAEKGWRFATADEQTIVNNESSEIIRMFYTAFDDILPEQYKNVVLYPDGLKDKIEEVNKWTYDDINNGVYKSGFATTQEAYERNVEQLFKSLDRTEAILAESASRGPFYFGAQLTEADVRLYTTIVRFDPVYVQHFKCNIKDIRSGYPHLHRWLRHLYWTIPAFGETTQFEHIKKHYTKSHKQINPFGITPVGPVPDILKEEEEVGAVKK